MVAIISFVVFVVSLFNIIMWKIEFKQTLEQVKNVQEKVEISEVIEEENKSIKIIIPEETIPQFDPYWGYIKMNLINVDFE